MGKKFKLEQKKIKKRYDIVENLGSYTIVDTILDKSITPRIATKEYAKQLLNKMIETGEIKQLIYKEELK